MKTFRHEHYMDQALALAQDAARRGEVPVGALIVQADTVIGEGLIPYANGAPQCGCSFDDCPDRIVNLVVGIYEINTGDIIRYYGDDVYPCGEHGSYAKWQGLIFERK